MRVWCILASMVALTVSLASDESLTVTTDDSVSSINSTQYLTAADEFIEYYDEEAEQEFLPEPEALTDEDEEEEVVVLDDETRIVAEALIQELDDLSNKLQDDETEETEQPEGLPTPSKVVSPSDVTKLERLLESAGLAPNSPLMRNLMQQRRTAIPASALGPGVAGIGELLSNTPINHGKTASAAVASNALLSPGMTKQNVEEIKLELRHMLFGPDRKTQNANRRQGGGRPGPQQQFNRNPQRRPTVPHGSPIQRQQQVTQQPQQRQQQQQNNKRPPIPIFLRPPRPAQGRPSVSSNELARQPISEFRAPASDFRLPESPFRQQIANTQFVPPTRHPTAISNNGNNNNAPSLRASTSPQPVGPPARPTAPRPTEDEFRPSLLNNRPTQHLQPASKNSAPPSQAQLPPPLSFRPQASSNLPQQNRQQPGPISTGRPIINGGGILTQSHFDAGANNQQRPSNVRPFKPECELYAEGICLEVRNYPTEAISNYLNRNKPALESMLAEVRSQSADDLVDGVSAAEERRYSYSHYYGNRRQGEDTHAHRDFAEDGGFLCPSDVKYARPQLAQTSRGVWKYIINMGEHTQTIRMERCLKPSGSCSYVSPHYKSHCIQVYNYHRLLSFEEGKGMHVDIYKIPVGCSCHVQGYAYLYPPLDGKTAGHVIPPAFPTEPSNDNTLNANRKISGQQPAPHPPRSRDSYEDEPEFDVPTSLKDFSSFMNEQFERPFGGPFSSSSKKGNSAGGGSSFGGNRRVDKVGHHSDLVAEDYVAQSSNIRNKQIKTNYDYHPILDFFNDKP